MAKVLVEFQNFNNKTAQSRKKKTIDKSINKQTHDKDGGATCAPVGLQQYYGDLRARRAWL